MIGTEAADQNGIACIAPTVMVRGSSHGSHNERDWDPFSSGALADSQPPAGYTPT